MRRTLDLTWSALQVEGDRVEVGDLKAAADDLERLVLDRDVDDSLARAAAAVVYACRASATLDAVWCGQVWNVAWEALEDILGPPAPRASLDLIKAQVERALGVTADGDSERLREWAAGRSLRSVVRDLQPKVPPSVARLAAAAARIPVDAVWPPLTSEVEEARRRAIAAVGATIWAKALDRLASRLPGGETDHRWGPVADAALALTAADRLSAADRAALIRRAGALLSIEPVR
jgi:hypothetical protein